MTAGAGTKRSRGLGTWSSAAFWLLLGLIGLGMVGLAGRVYQMLQQRALREARATLQLVDRLKAEQFEIWRRQRASDVAFVYKNPVNDEHLDPYLRGEEPERHEAAVREWLDAILRDSLYRSVILVDTQGMRRLAVGDAGWTISESERSNALQVIRSGRNQVSPIHLRSDSQRLHTILCAPVALTRREGIVGAMLLEIDPLDVLFPMVSSWPRLERTGETQLAEREGDEVVVFRTAAAGAGAPAMVRHPLSETNEPAVLALLGQTGVVMGLEGEGRPVLAAVRAVPDSPWFLVTRLGQDEVVDHVRREAATVGGGFLALLLLLALVLFWWRRRSEARFYRRELEMEQELRQRESATREQRHFFERIFEQSLAGHWDWFIAERRLLMSPRFKATLGYGPEELPDTQEAWAALVHPEDLPMLLEAYQRHVESHGRTPYQIEVRYLHRDGSVVHVICAGLVIEWDAAGAPLRMVGCHTDLTERRKAEAALRASEQRLADLIRHAPLPLILAGRDGRLLEINDSAARVFGYGLADLATLGDWFERTCPNPAYRAEVQAAWSRALAEADAGDGRIVAQEFQLSGRDGTARTLEVSGVGGPENVLLMFMDVTARRAAAQRLESRLEEQAGLLKTLVHTIPDLIWLKDADGVYLACNREFEKFFGHAEAEIIGRCDADFMPPEVADSFRAHDRAAMAAGGPTVNEEWITYASDGHRALLRTTKTPMHAPDGRLIGVLGIGHDITELRRQQEALQRAGERNLALLRNASDGIHILDPAGNLLEASDSFFAMLGYTRDEMIGMNVAGWDALFNAEERTEKLAQQFRHRGRSEFVARQRRKDGRVIDVEISGQPLLLDGQPVLFNSSRDISERIALTQRLDETLLLMRETQAIAKVGGWKVNPESGYLMWTDEIYRLVEHPREEALDLRTGLAYYAPEDLPEITALLEQTWRSGTGFTRTCRMIARSGREFWAELRCIGRVYDARGDYIAGTFQDITDRREAEAALSAERRIRETLLESIPGIFYALNAEGALTFWSRRLEQVTGRSAAELSGLPAVRLFAADGAPQVAERIARVFGQGEGDAEADLVTKDGRRIPYYFTGRRIELAGQFILVGAGVDISARKAAEQALCRLNDELEARVRQKTADLQASFAKLRDTDFAMERVGIGIHWVDFETGRFVHVNRTAAELIGYTPAEMLQLRVPDIDPHFPEEAFHAIKQRIRAEGFVKFETEQVRRDGRTLPVEMTIYYHAGADGSPPRLISFMLDIAVRKRMEEELRKLSRVVEQSPAAVVITDTSGRIEYVNPQFTAATGYTREEVLGGNPRVFKSGVHSPDFYRELWRTISAGHVWRGEICSRRRSGDALWESVAITPVRNERDEITHYAAIKIDITARRESEAKLHALFAAMTDVILVFDRDGRYVEIAPTNPDPLYRPRPDWIGQTLYDVFPRAEAGQIHERIGEALARHGTVTFENRLSFDGRDVWFMAAVTELTPDTVILVARDITEFKRADLALRASEARYRALFDGSEDMVMLHELDASGAVGRFVEVNEATVRTLGYTRDELRQMGPDDIRHPDSRPRRAEIEAQLGAGDHAVFDALHVTREGQMIPVEISASRVELAGRPMMLVIGRDVTERKRAAAELQQAKEAAEQASRAKSDFLANMSHELRTPLTAVIGFSEILADQTFGPVNARQARYVSNILQAGRHLLSLINDVLDLSKVEAGRMKLECGPLSLVGVVDAVLELTRGRAHRHQLEVRREIPPDLTVFADERSLKQILFNLLSNAAKFTPDGGRIVVSARRVEGAVRIEVSDTGIGVCAADQARIFEQFEQVDSSLGRRQQGTGLGLALCRRLVELHGGRIGVTSEGDNQGSVFHFTLPDPAGEGERSRP